MPPEPPTTYEPIPGVENLDHYRQGGYHPVHIGDTFLQGKYVVVHKLGHGNMSTVWLAAEETTQQEPPAPAPAPAASAGADGGCGCGCCCWAISILPYRSWRRTFRAARRQGASSTSDIWVMEIVGVVGERMCCFRWKCLSWLGRMKGIFAWSRRFRDRVYRRLRNVLRKWIVRNCLWHWRNARWLMWFEYRIICITTE